MSQVRPFTQEELDSFRNENIDEARDAFGRAFFERDSESGYVRDDPDAEWGYRFVNEWDALTQDEKDDYLWRISLVYRLKQRQGDADTDG